MHANQEVVEWTRMAARRLLDEFGEAAAIETADYQLCSFVLAAAEVALKSTEFARHVGELMGSKRDVS